MAEQTTKYTADSITRIDKDGKEYFYDLEKIKDTGQKVVDNKSKPIADGSVSFNDIILQNEKNSNSNKSSKTDKNFLNSGKDEKLQDIKLFIKEDILKSKFFKEILDEIEFDKKSCEVNNVKYV